MFAPIVLAEDSKYYSLSDQEWRYRARALKVVQATTTRVALITDSLGSDFNKGFEEIQVNALDGTPYLLEKDTLMELANIEGKKRTLPLVTLGKQPFLEWARQRALTSREPTTSLGQS